ncbi:DUF6301 family protein [Nocardia fluminea]|uniref:DUF6301 family protein n=1 Tax=Nocardia fluminea TaxID=134984 RepID=UPI00364AE107
MPSAGPGRCTTPTRSPNSSGGLKFHNAQRHARHRVRPGQWHNPRQERPGHSIELQLTDFADAAEKIEVATAFDNFGAAVSARLGSPTARVAGPPLQYRWAGAEATVVLERSAASVWLYLITNARLAADDRNIELDEQGLL